MKKPDIDVWIWHRLEFFMEYLLILIRQEIDENVEEDDTFLGSYFFESLHWPC